MEEKNRSSCIDLFHQSIPMKKLIDMHKECGYVIGMDLGGGIFDVKLLDIEDKGEGSEPEIRQLYMADDLSSRVYCIVGYDYEPDPEHEGGFIITKKYVGGEAMTAMAYFTNFKAVPTQENLAQPLRPDNDLRSMFSRTRADLIRDAVSGLFAKVCTERNSLQNCDLKKMMLVVGIPSSEDWKREKENYLALIREATGVREVLSISESSAAVLYMTEKFRSQALGCILIIDLGAFSADITYLDSENRIPVEMSVELGGREIDSVIRRQVNKKAQTCCPDIECIIDDLSVRLEKENHWPKARRSARFVVEGLEKPVILTQQEMEDCVTKHPLNAGDEGESYTEELESFIDDFKRRNQNAPVNVVLIVGGVSNVKPAYDAICQKVSSFWPEAEILPQWEQIKEINNDECVSCGVLRYYARAMAAVEGMQRLQEDLRDCIKTDLFPVVARNLAETLPPLLNNEEKTGLIDQIVLQWAENAEDVSAEDLRVMITTEISGNSEIRQAFEACMKPEDYNSLAENMSAKIGGFVQTLYKQDEQQQSEQSRRVLQNMEGILTGLSDSLIPIVIREIESKLSSIVGFVIELAVIVSILMIAPGALGKAVAVVGYLIWKLIRSIGKDEDIRLSDKKLSRDKRKEYAQKLTGEDMADKMRENLGKTDGLEKMLGQGKFDDVVDRITEQIRSEIEKAIYQ